MSELSRVACISVTDFGPDYPVDLGSHTSWSSFCKAGLSVTIATCVSKSLCTDL